MSEYKQGDVILIRYGAGTQVARVRATTRSGNVQVQRFQATTAGCWYVPTGSVPASKVIGLLPENDRRRALPNFPTSYQAVEDANAAWLARKAANADPRVSS